MFSSKICLISSLLSAFLITSEGFSQNEVEVLKKATENLNQIKPLKRTEDLRNFLSENLNSLDSTTIEALQNLAESKSQLAKKILVERSLDQKLSKFSQRLSPENLEQFRNATTRLSEVKNEVKSEQESSINLDRNLLQSLRSFQDGLSPDEANELISRITKNGSAYMSNFGSGD